MGFTKRELVEFFDTLTALVSKNINIGDRKKLINGDGFVFGVPGLGKSFFCKMEMSSVFRGSKDEIIIID